MTYPESLRALRHRNFRLYFLGMLASLAGVWMQQMAMGWLIFRLTDSVFMLGLVGFAWQIPVLLLGPVGGMLADRMDRRRLLIATQSAGFVFSVVLAALTIAGHIAPWHIVTLALLLGILNAIDTPTRHSMARFLVEDAADMPNAIALGGLNYHFGRMSGPAVGGLALAWFGDAACFVVNALAYLLMTGLFLRMQIRAQARSTTEAGAGLRAALRYVAGEPVIRASLLLTAAVGFAVSPYSTVMPYFVEHVYGGDAKMLGLLAGATGLGAIVTGIYMLKRMDPSRLPRLILRAELGMGVMLLVYAFSSNPWITGVAMLLLGACMFVAVTGSNAVIQSGVSEAMRGRVMGLYSMGLVGCGPLGNLLAGMVGETAGVQVWVAASGIFTLFVALAYGRAARRFVAVAAWR